MPVMINDQVVPADARRAKADICLCLTCGSIDNECPINIATGRFRPQKIVRMANLGLIDELINNPAVWLCLDFGKCFDACSRLVESRVMKRMIKDHAITVWCGELKIYPVPGAGQQECL